MDVAFERRKRCEAPITIRTTSGCSNGVEHALLRFAEVAESAETTINAEIVEEQGHRSLPLCALCDDRRPRVLRYLRPSLRLRPREERSRVDEAERVPERVLQVERTFSPRSHRDLAHRKTTVADRS